MPPVPVAPSIAPKTLTLTVCVTEVGMSTAIVWARRVSAIALAGVLAVGTTALAQSAAPASSTQAGPPYGPGAMYYYHHGMKAPYGKRGVGPGAYGCGYGYGHGRSMGSGMGGGYGMGFGPMVGYGSGLGMMGGRGMGPGLMYGYAAHALGLTADQRDKLARIWNDSMKKAWPVMGGLREQNFQLSRLLRAETPDRAAVNKIYGRITDLGKQLLDLRLQARQEMMGVLTAEQRKELRERFYQRW